MLPSRVVSIGAVFVLAMAIAAQGQGQSAPQPGQRRGDPVSPGGRPLADPGTEYEQLRRAHADLLLKQTKLKSAYESAVKDELPALKKATDLLAAKKAGEKRYADAQFQVNLSRDLNRRLGTGGADARSLSELETARKSLAKINQDYDREKRVLDTFQGKKREAEGRLTQLDREIEAYNQWVDAVRRKR